MTSAVSSSCMGSCGSPWLTHGCHEEAGVPSGQYLCRKYPSSSMMSEQNW